MAASIVLVAIVQVVVVGELFPWRDAAQRHHPNASTQLFRFAIGVAGVVDVHRHAVTIDHGGTVSDAKEVGRF